MNTIEINVWIEEIGRNIIAECYIFPEQSETFDQEGIGEEIEVISTNHEYFDADYIQNNCYKECCDELERLKQENFFHCDATDW